MAAGFVSGVPFTTDLFLTGLKADDRSGDGYPPGLGCCRGGCSMLPWLPAGMRLLGMNISSGGGGRGGGDDPELFLLALAAALSLDFPGEAPMPWGIGSSLLGKAPLDEDATITSAGDFLFREGSDL